MSIRFDADAASAVFQAAWEDTRQAAAETTKPQEEEAMELFRKAVSNCDREVERMMDSHHKSVAESAKKLAEYRKRKAMEDRQRQDAIERRLLSEMVRVESINHRNMLENERLREQG